MAELYKTPEADSSYFLRINYRDLVLNSDATSKKISEVILHSAVYCGAPAAQEAFRVAKEVFNECDYA